MLVKGRVYVITNEAMPNIVKVGYTFKSSFARAKQLGGTGIPHVFHVMYEAFVEDPRAVEKAAHAMLGSKHEGKEWFRCSEEDAIAAIKTCAKNVLREKYYVNYTKELRQLQDETFTRSRYMSCVYGGCFMQSTLQYKEKYYCDDHYEKLRKQRFDWARSILNS